MGLSKYGGEDGERIPTHKSGSATNIICVVETQFQVLRRFYIYTKIMYLYKDSVKGLLKRHKKYSSSITKQRIEKGAQKKSLCLFVILKYPKRALFVIF